MHIALGIGLEYITLRFCPLERDNKLRWCKPLYDKDCESKVSYAVTNCALMVRPYEPTKKGAKRPLSILDAALVRNVRTRNKREETERKQEELCGVYNSHRALKEQPKE